MKRLELLDYGRFLAAVMVVIFHYTFNGIANGKITSITHIPSLINLSKYGYLGVEFFFMISGYVIFFSAKSGSASKFAIGRATRLYPSYWFAVLFTSLFAFQWGEDLMSVYPRQIIVNLTMLQQFIGVAHVDGVYWTLAYEITFYAAVFLLLFFGLQKYLDAIFIAWPALMVASLILGKNWLPYLGGYYYYFSAGALFAILGHKFRWSAIISLLVAYVLCIHFSAGHTAVLTKSKGVEFSPVIIAMIITAFFSLFSYISTPKGQSIKLPLSKSLGALTYPMYLIHAHFGYMLINKYATEQNKTAIYALTFSIVIIISLFMHNIIEQSLSKLWKSLFTQTIGRTIDGAQTILFRKSNPYKNH